jgi:hypothetical protein
LRTALPEIIPNNEKEIIRFLRAARHAERYPATDTRRGRPSRYERESLLRVASHLRATLARETSERVSLSSFVDHYLRVLDLPSDLTEALAGDDINLFEAEQLARLSGRKLNNSPSAARRERAALLATHVQSRLSGARLRAWVNEMLKKAEAAAPDGGEVVPPAVEDLEDFDPHDPTHLFYDEIKRLGFALRDIRPEHLTDDLLKEYLRVSEPLWAVLAKIEKRRQPSNREIMKL